MRGFVVLALVTLLVAGLAGCSAKKNGDGDATDTETQSGSSTGPSSTGSSTQSGTGAPVTNTAPVATLNANVTTGGIPLAVNFTISGTDADGDALTFVLSFGDNSANQTGTLPAGNVAYTFTAAGDFTVELTVSDGTLANNATVTIGAVESGGGIPPPVTFTGTATGACDPSGETGECTDPDIVHTFTVTAAVTSMHLKLTWDEVPFSDLDFYVFDAAPAERGRGACSNLQPVPEPGILTSCNRAQSEETTITEIVPGDAGQWTVKIRPFQAPMVAYTLTITFT